MLNIRAYAERLALANIWVERMLSESRITPDKVTHKSAQMTWEIGGSARIMVVTRPEHLHGLDGGYFVCCGPGSVHMSEMIAMATNRRMEIVSEPYPYNPRLRLGLEPVSLTKAAEAGMDRA